MSAAATRLHVSACTLALAWLFAAIAPAGHPALVATTATVAMALTALVALQVAGVIIAPPRTTALTAIHGHDRDRRRAVVRLADPDAAGRPRPRAPGRPFAG